jgi:hypothetical protein
MTERDWYGIELAVSHHAGRQRRSTSRRSRCFFGHLSAAVQSTPEREGGEHGPTKLYRIARSDKYTVQSRMQSISESNARAFVSRGLGSGVRVWGQFF